MLASGRPPTLLARINDMSRTFPSRFPGRPERVHRLWQTFGVALIVAPIAARAQTGDPLPLKHAPQATHPAITAADLETRLYIYADDSMEGRRAGTPGDLKATAYIAAEFKRLKLVPAGDSGTYFQNIPLVTLAFDTAAPLVVGTHQLKFKSDFLPINRRPSQSIDGAQVVYGGQLCDSSATRLTDAQTAHKVVLFTLPADPMSRAMCMQQAGRVPLPKASGIALPGLQVLPPQIVDYLAHPQTVLRQPEADTTRRPLIMLITQDAARAFVTRPLDSLAVGDTG